jgi:hypothetical protein
LKKEKEKIRAQMIKALSAWRGKSGFDFFDSSNRDFKPLSIDLDDNEIEVLLMNLNDISWILLTTKCLHIRQNKSIIRLEGGDIEKFEFLNQANEKAMEQVPEFTSSGEYKSWLFSGDFSIEMKNETSLVVYLPHHDFGYCLFNAIRKLQFVSKKYEGV